MSQVFRELLQKVGSGPHTSKPLTREEAATAAAMMLQQEATPIQIGAFLIAHRMKRPTGTELAGMLDAYERFGPQVAAVSSPHPVAVFSVPYDGRSRTAPILVLTALVLATCGCPVLMHGGDRMATKYGVPMVELWQALGIDWTHCSLETVQNTLEQFQLGFVYTPLHFPLLQPLVEARDQIGKRPPLATLELLWCPYAGEAHLIAGYVHPPTETMMQEALALRGSQRYTTVKGLEGSCDLPRDRTAIVGAWRGTELERILLNARDVGLGGTEVPYTTLEDWTETVQQILNGRTESSLYAAVLWNCGFYLWHLGFAETFAAGIDKTKAVLGQHQVLAHLQALQRN